MVKISRNTIFVCDFISSYIEEEFLPCFPYVFRERCWLVEHQMKVRTAGVSTVRGKKASAFCFCLNCASLSARLCGNEQETKTGGENKRSP